VVRDEGVDVAGVVVGPDGALWVTTGNTSLFCLKDGIGFLDAIAGLYLVPLLGDGTFGPPEAIATNIATFGDGLAFDREGNLYAIFDTVAETFDASIVFVLPHGQRALRRAIVRHDNISANLAFGGVSFTTRSRR